MTRISYVLCFLLLLAFSSCVKEVEQPIDCTDPELCSVQPILVENLVVNDLPIAFASSSALNFYQAFERKTKTGDVLEFTALQKSFPDIAQDQFGNVYDVFGMATSGPNKGRKLASVHSGLGYWFSWSSTYPRIILNEVEGLGSQVLSENEEWLVSQDFVFRGAASDGIPAINDPEFVEVANKEIITTGLLRDDDELIIVRLADTTRIYPIKILNYHEIVNDMIGNEFFSVCYAPFTSTSSVWSRSVGTAVLEFGVSGLVYNNNILLFDRNTRSFWNQLLEISVNGVFQSTRPERVAYFRTTWKTWKETGNDHILLKGVDRLQFDYNEDPLGDYAVDHSYIPFEISSYDTRKISKSRVFGIVVDGKAVAYTHED